MTKSELIEALTERSQSLQLGMVENCVNEILQQISASLEDGRRVEIRGFGSFSLHYRQSRVGRNPKTGESVKLSSKYVPHFKAGKELKDRVDAI